MLTRNSPSITHAAMACDACASDFGEDVGTCCPPDVGFRISVALGKVGLDVTHQLVD